MGNLVGIGARDPGQTPPSFKPGLISWRVNYPIRNWTAAIFFTVISPKQERSRLPPPSPRGCEACFRMQMKIRKHPPQGQLKLPRRPIDLPPLKLCLAGFKPSRGASLRRWLRGRLVLISEILPAWSWNLRPICPLRKSRPLGLPARSA
jgi:hypothetical protein